MIPTPSPPLSHACELNPKGFRWARAGNPWVYRDDLEFAGGDAGDIVRVTFEGQTLGSAFLSLRSKIALRWIERGPEPHVPDDEFWRRRLLGAISRRDSVAGLTNAYRLVHDLADDFPGCVVDRYDEVAVVQTTTAGTDRLLPLISRLLQDLLGLKSIVLRNDAAVREREGLARHVKVLAGQCPEQVWCREDAPSGARVEFAVRPMDGQKTGAFLDQRENRWRTAELAAGRFLDVFSYVGLFGLHAARNVTEVVSVDNSRVALELGSAAARRMRIGHWRAHRQNAFEFLKQAVSRGERFDTVVLDPPAFAKTRSEVPAAERGYREINRRAMQLVPPGGYLVTCSCSFNVDEPRFLDILRRAAAESNTTWRVHERRGQAEDHPVVLHHPAGAYLKCVLMEKIR